MLMAIVNKIRVVLCFFHFSFFTSVIPNCSWWLSAGQEIGREVVCACAFKKVHVFHRIIMFIDAIQMLMAILL